MKNFQVFRLSLGEVYLLHVGHLLDFAYTFIKSYSILYVVIRALGGNILRRKRFAATCSVNVRKINPVHVNIYHVLQLIYIGYVMFVI